MKVLIAGATGTLGSAAADLLVARGHEVVGLTRTAEKAATLEGMGARPVIGDVLDPQSVKNAVAEAAPDAILQVLNALPKGGPRTYGDLEPTNELRSRGTANLVAAAREASVGRYVAENFFGTYGFKRRRGHVVTEAEPILRTMADASFAPVVEAMAALEDLVLGVGGVVLRFGAFYGPTVPSTRGMVRALKRRMMPVVGEATGRVPWIHIDDAAAATVLALESGAPGEAYNVVDDEPVETKTLTRYAAHAVGAPRPLRVPRFVGRLSGPYLSKVLQTDIVLSNLKARQELGWEPAFPSYREGWADIAAGV